MQATESTPLHDCWGNIEVSAYTKKVQLTSQSLFTSGWTKTSFLAASALGEPMASIFTGVHGFGWKKEWKKRGFFDAGNKEGKRELKAVLKDKADNDKPYLMPVILFNGFGSNPGAWLSWAEELQKARDNGMIGEVITIDKLPNDLEGRQPIVRKTIDKVCKFYRKAFNLTEAKVILIGHSLGGYSAHMAAFEKEYLHDEEGVERRRHSLERNPNVATVISLGAPGWFCCPEQKDEFSPENKDIYPLNGLEGFTEDQLKVIRENHEGIYDIIPVEDAIAPVISPLPPENIRYVKHKHVGSIRCAEVCRRIVLMISEANRQKREDSDENV